MPIRASGPASSAPWRSCSGGWSNPAIARQLHVSPGTTKRDVAELLRRFDAPNRMALSATALRLGLHPFGPR